MWRALKGVGVGVAVLSPLASHSALALRQGYGVALGLAAAQAVAVGVLLWGSRARTLGVLVTGTLLLVLWLGGRHSPASGLAAAAGVSHAMLYAGLLWVFGRTLLPGRDSLVTGLARRLNPRFHAGMVPYTRKVTAAWCLFFAANIAASAALLLFRPGWWMPFVTAVHAPLVLLMAVGEFAVRSWRWRHEHHTGLRDTVAGVRRITRERMGRGTVDRAGAAGGRTSPTA